MKKYIYTLALSLLYSISHAQTHYFPPSSGNVWDTISPNTLSWCPAQIDSLYTYLESNNTKAFILLKDGKIVLEKYFGTHTQSSPWQWASAGKTITAFMVGIAAQEGHLSLSDNTSAWLGRGWTDCTPEQEGKITIRHQLTMSSGLDDGVEDSYCTLDTCLRYKAEAGTRWAYHNAPYTLLDGVLENACGSTLNTYVTQKLKNPTGMTGAFVPVGYNNVYFSNARSMARFGLLILNRGNWDGNQILSDSNYYRQMVNTSQNLNPSYGYLWWLNGKDGYMLPGAQFVFNGYLNPHAPADMFAAMGKDGQFLNVVPGQNLVWVRMGNAPEQLPVPFLMNDKIWEYLNELDCGGLTTDPDKLPEPLQLFPNPAGNQLRIRAEKGPCLVQLFSPDGRMHQSIRSDSGELDLCTGDLPVGLYMIRILSEDGNGYTARFYKE